MLGWILPMESYEEFCSRVYAKLQESEAKPCSVTSTQQGAMHSIIQFYGVALLSPLLSAEQHEEMKEHRQRAVQLESERHSQRKACLLARVQGILDSVQVCMTSRESRAIAPPIGCSWKSESSNVISSPLWNGGDSDKEGVRGIGGGVESITPTHLNGTEERAGEPGEEEEEDIDSQRLSLQVLLRRSKKLLEEDQARKGSQISSRVTPAHVPQDDPCKQVSRGTDAGGDAGPSLGSALSPAQLRSSTDGFADSVLGCTPCSLTGSYAQLPSPELSQSPRPHRSRPRPVSAGNILISYPMSAAELSPQKGQEDHPLAAWGAGSTAVSSARSPVHPSTPAGSLLPSPSCAWHCSSSCASPVDSSGSPSGASPQGQSGPMPGFRRRSHTFDVYSLPQRPAVDRSQERVPRFLGGQLPTPFRRSPPAPLNRSYDVESPSPMLQRPHVTSEPTPRGNQEGRRGSQEGRLTIPGYLATPITTQDTNTGTVQEQVQALEEMRKRLQEEHAQQLCILIAEQEREQQCLQQELKKERRLRDQPGELAEGLRPDWKAASDHCSPLNPDCFPDGSPGLCDYSKGYPTEPRPHIPSSSGQSPVHLWGMSCGNYRGRMLVLTSQQQRALCRLGATIRGFLTRRLLSTEKLRHLRQTVQDTQEFIHTFQSEAPGRRGSMSAQDQSLQARVRAQLHAALFDIHDIFFVMPLRDRLALLQQDRELRAERRLREMDKARSSKDRVILSAATQKALDRKKQRAADVSGQGKRVQLKPKRNSSKILQPNQGQNTAVPGQLLRQGSLYKKSPEERVKRCDSLRKQHSLG